MTHSGGEHDGLSIRCELFPLPHHGGIVHLHIQHGLGLVHVEFAGSGLAQRRQPIVRAFKRTDERPGPYEETHCDETVQGKLIAAIAEDMAQTFPVAPRRRGRDPKNPAVRVFIPHGVHDLAVARGHGVMRLVDDEQIQFGNGGQSPVPAQRLHHGERGVPFPVFDVGVEHPDAGARVDLPIFFRILEGQLVTVLENKLLSADTSGERRQEHRFARARRRHRQGVAMLFQRGDSLGNHLFLVRPQDHFSTSPKRERG